MNRAILLTLTALILAITSVTEIEAASKKEQLLDLSGKILQTLQSFYPVLSTQKGIHTYDDQLTDYSSGAVKKVTSRLTDYTTKLYRLRNAKFSADDRANYLLLRANVETALQDLKRIKWHKKLPHLYVDEAVSGIFSLMVSAPEPAKVNLDAVLGRMRATKKLFKSARENIKNPSEMALDVATESLGKATRFFQDVAGELMRAFPERADEILKTITSAREAMSEYDIYLSSLPVAATVAIGKDDYNYKLAHEYFLEYDADSLLRIGQALLTQAEHDYSTYRENVESNHQNGSDSVFVPGSFGRQDIIDYYRWESGQVVNFLSSVGLFAAPKEPVSVTLSEGPAYLRSILDGVTFVISGAFDAEQHGHIFVRPIPDDLDRPQLVARFRYVHRRGFAGSLVQKGYPANLLQIQAVAATTDPVRKWQASRLAVDGWKLFCDELIYDAGLYGEEEAAMRLAILKNIRFHAVSLIADVKLHTGLLTFAECLGWMIEALDARTESDKSYLRHVLRSYSLNPTAGIAPLLGRQQIKKLYEDKKQQDGDAFSSSAFFESLLASGPIPPLLIPQIRASQ